MCPDKENKKILVGINSWSRLKDNKIGKEKYPAVFAHVLEYRKWIDGVIKNSEKQPTIRSDAMKVLTTCLILIFLILLIHTITSNDF